VDKAVHKAVRARAGHRCEYCRFPETFAELPFHLDHIIALQHGGPTVPENLALACCYCNRYKGPNLSGIDPESGNVVSLFHPRQLGLNGGINTYTYTRSNPVRHRDPLGLDIWVECPSGNEPEFHQSINVGAPFGTYTSMSYGAGLTALVDERHDEDAVVT
jgi:hypothetical protein